MYREREGSYEAEQEGEFLLMRLRGKGWKLRRRKAGRRNISVGALHWGCGDRGATGMERDEGFTMRECLAPKRGKILEAFIFLIGKRIFGEGDVGSEGEGILQSFVMKVGESGLWAELLGFCGEGAWMDWDVGEMV
ncbi:uncharacterized protein MONOS_16281 [Monocercomonoides exilis]|uniref:uncharacterized protein n=1 Tax=Monocercomonoides exilis TaxID=2049356 RepID=UPI00355AA2A1|nr:hypothetical protein MONOS_16281 [Monocercomonoides exilis]|eukprot:MONOS_16281.1-p1 / transcript=MONOS_16281.1 / gene=MONOS_16281 / organism=Monocercomonoides_exilis_PA203 / gene_product=unspecified product / transcript_product=unspecified product / location=Mono_scaffold01611:4348-4860(-) / protein_length=136 / sequence_SO=supercontig / SO=protein_coding / is_pseudo=false